MKSHNYGIILAGGEGTSFWPLCRRHQPLQFLQIGSARKSLLRMTYERLDGEENGVKTLHKAKNVLTVRMVLNHTGGFPFEISAKRSDVRGGGWSGPGSV